MSDGVATPLSDCLGRYRPVDGTEARDVQRIRRLLAVATDPWARSEPLHVTASALIVHPPSQRVLLRWHERHGRYMQVGGHGDAGEHDPLAVALREAAEETGLADLRSLRSTGQSLGAPSRQEAELVQVVIVPVPSRREEPAHEHADLRYVFATDRPDEAHPENEAARLKWASWGEAFELVGEDNLHVLLERARQLAG